MRIPARPPQDADIWKRLSKDPELLERLLATPINVTNDPYLHWDSFRRRPAPEGIDHEAWWVVVKTRRSAIRQFTPFQDNKGNPFWFCEPGFVRSTVRNVDLHWGGAIASATLPTPAEARTFLVRSLAEEPFSSSFLEGAATTREIAKELIFKKREPRTRDERMVLNNYRALLFVKQNASQPLTIDLILQLHKIVTEGTLDRPDMAGVLRGPKDEVYVFDESNDEILHQPPPADELRHRLELLCAFANEQLDEHGFIHPAIRAIIIHFMVGYDHPFVDGNGRTARALFYWFMLRSGYWLAEYASISSILKDAPAKYARAYLETETDDCDLTYFIINQCEAIALSEKRLHDYIERKREEVDALAVTIEKARKDGGFNHRQTALLNDLVRRRVTIVNITSHQTTHSVSYHTARNDLEELTNRGLLSKRRIGRDTQYLASPNLDQKLLEPSG